MATNAPCIMERTSYRSYRPETVLNITESDVRRLDFISLTFTVFGLTEIWLVNSYRTVYLIYTKNGYRAVTDAEKDSIDKQLQSRYTQG